MQKQTVKVIQGNEATLVGALLAGCRFFAGYPITPASEIAELAALRLPEQGGIYLQLEDEIASINAMTGAAWAGLKVMTATSGPGFSLMQEGLGYACVTQTPCVIVNVMRGGPAIGQATASSQQDVYQAKYGSHGEYENIVLVPSSAQECLDLTIRAFNLSEKYLVPVIVLSDEVVGHTRERVEFPVDPEIINRVPPPSGHDYQAFEPIAELNGVPYRASFGQGYNILIEPQLHTINGTRCGHNFAASAACLERLSAKIKNNLEDIQEVETAWLDDAEVVIVAYGSTARAAQGAVELGRAEGKKLGFVKLKTLFPFPDKILADLSQLGRQFVVPEMNSGKIWREVQLAVGGKVLSLPKLGGEMHTPKEILTGIWS